MSTEFQVQIHFDADAGLLHAQVVGILRPEAMPALAAQVLTAVEAHACRSMVLDYTAAARPGSTADLYQINSRLHALGVQPADIIAVVHAPAANAADRNTLAETIAWNRGWHNVKYFDDLAAARAWVRAAQLEQRTG